MIAATLGLSACHRHRPNVLLVTFDTTRADHMGYATGRKGVTPMLDGLAARGAWFTTCETSQPLTLPSHTTIMTGLYPFHHGVRNNGTYIVPDKDVTLAEMFRGAGYATHAIVSAFVLDSQFGLDQGFDSYDDDLSGGPKQKMFMFKEIKADETARKAILWLREQRPKDKPFFLWVHFFDPHADYDPPAEFAAKFPGDPYSGEIAYADHGLGLILAQLDSSGLLGKKTLVVFTGDHGDGLGEHGESTHAMFVYDSTTRVPLLFEGPGVPENKRVGQLVRTIDIAPTILQLTGLPIPKNLDGRSVVPLWEGRHEHRLAYTETLMPRLNFGWAGLRSLRDGTTKVIEAPRPEAYDLSDDPHELHNLAAHEADLPDDARALFLELHQIIETDPFSHGKQREAALDAESRRRLASLGYVWGADTGQDGSRPDPKDRIDYWNRFQQAQALIRRHDDEGAKRIIGTLLEEDPNNVIAMGSMALVLARTGDRDGALKVYRRMIALDPSRDAPYLGAAGILGEEKRFAEAMELAHTVIKLQPENPAGYTKLADLLLDQGKLRESEQWFRQALEIDPHSSLAVSGLGNCLNRQNRLDEARSLLAAFHAKDPSSHAVTYNLAVVSERMGDHRAALQLYQQAVKLEPDHSMSWNNLGSLLDRMGKRQEAVSCIRKAHELDPANVEATYNLGALLAASGKPAEALRLIDEALRERPTLIQAAIMRARTLERLGRISQAAAAWAQIARNHPAANLQLARLELKLGHRRSARAALRKAIAAGGDRARQAVAKHPELRSLLP